MHTTFGDPFIAPSAPRKPRTVEALVNVTASTSPRRRASRASAGNDRGMRVRYASTRVGVQPFAASASSRPGGAMSARAHSTRPLPRGNARASPAVVNVAGTRSGLRRDQRR